jgi:hypothetical protein
MPDDTLSAVGEGLPGAVGRKLHDRTATYTRSRVVAICPEVPKFREASLGLAEPQISENDQVVGITLAISGGICNGRSHRGPSNEQDDNLQ